MLEETHGETWREHANSTHSPGLAGIKPDTWEATVLTTGGKKGGAFCLKLAEAYPSSCRSDHYFREMVLI